MDGNVYDSTAVRIGWVETRGDYIEMAGGAARLLYMA